MNMNELLDTIKTNIEKIEYVSECEAVIYPNEETDKECITIKISILDEYFNEPLSGFMTISKKLIAEAKMEDMADFIVYKTKDDFIKARNERLGGK